MARRRRRKKKKKTQPFEIGDSVLVKPGVKDVDLGYDLSGWQGRVQEINQKADAPDTVLIAWDSLTLRDLPAKFIETCEVDGMSWAEYNIYLDKVQKTQPRDTQHDVDEASAELSRQYAWVYLEPEGKNISKVLAGVDPSDEWSCFEAWYAHLEKTLKFPIEAVVAEFQERGPLRAGERVTITSLDDVYDLYGVIVNVKKGRRRFGFPLCDLKAARPDSPWHDTLQEYAVWFANR